MQQDFFSFLEVTAWHVLPSALHFALHFSSSAALIVLAEVVFLEVFDDFGASCALTPIENRVIVRKVIIFVIVKRFVFLFVMLVLANQI